MTEPSDADLWHRVRRGDADAFGELFNRYGPTIHRFALRRTGDPDHADDVTATVFLEAWRRRDRTDLHQPTALPWLYGVATHVLHNWRRSRRRHDAALDRLRQRAEPSPRLVERQAEAADEARRVLDRLPRLPRRELDVLVLAAWEGLSTTEIASALDIPPGTVKSRLHRARRRLRDLAEPGQPSEPVPLRGDTPRTVFAPTPAATHARTLTTPKDLS